jgi:hypothetical protein
MSKSILLAAAAVVGIGTVATAYYMTPIELAASETPAILVDASPTEVVRKIRTISMTNYLVHAGAKSERAIEEAQIYVTLSDARVISDTVTAFDLMRGDDHLMQFLITVKPAADGKSAVDVQTLAGDSKLASNPSTHPYDVKLALSAADFMATDYVSSILKGHPMLMGDRLEKEMAKRYALEGDAAFASMERIKKTFWETYTADLIQENENYAEDTAASSAEDDFDDENASDPASDADADVADFESGAEFAERAVDAAIAASE